METIGAATTLERARHFKVGDWLVSPELGQLSQADRIEHVEPMAMKVLVYLAEHPGEVVTREDLERHVWRGALVGYDAVTNTVIKLRKALGDQAREPGIIATIPKRGYRLIAPVRLLEAGARQPPSAIDTSVADASPTSSPRSTSWRYVGFAGAALALLGLVVAVYLFRSPASSESTSVASTESSRTRSIVVLPFDDLSEGGRFESFADGITEDIITDLSGLPALLVIASNTSFALKDKEVPARQLAAELDVDFVLDGSIRRQGDTVRVNARLVDARSGYQKWADRYDRQLAEVFAVQDEVTRSIVEALALKVSRQEAERLARRTTNNLDAYDHFQEGQRLANISTPETNLQAQAAYRQAIEADSDYGRAYGALAYTLSYSYRRGWTDAPMQTIDRALELARKAVALDDSIPQTYWALGYVYLMRKEYEQAEAAVTQAVKLAPNYADGYGLLALIKNALGDPEPAITLIQKGMLLNPYYTWDYPYNLGRAHYTLGRIDEAILALEEARRRNENVVPIRLHLAASYVRAGRQEDAEWEIQEIELLSPNETISLQVATHPIRNEALMDAFLADLRTAGLPE